MDECANAFPITKILFSINMGSFCCFTKSEVIFPSGSFRKIDNVKRGQKLMVNKLGGAQRGECPHPHLPLNESLNIVHVHKFQGGARFRQRVIVLLVPPK